MDIRDIPYYCGTKISIPDQMWEELLTIGTVVKNVVVPGESIFLWYSSKAEATFVQFGEMFLSIKDTDDSLKVLSQIGGTGKNSENGYEIPFTEATWKDLYSVGVLIKNPCI